MSPCLGGAVLAAVIAAPHERQESRHVIGLAATPAFSLRLAARGKPCAARAIDLAVRVTRLASAPLAITAPRLIALALAVQLVDRVEHGSRQGEAAPGDNGQKEGFIQAPSARDAVNGRR
jgi:hypothetical protein